MRKSAIFFLVSLCLFFCEGAFSCTVFSICNGSHFSGANFDWHMEHGYILVNPANISKVAASVKNPASWISKYGSITLNQYGREFPNQGMNQAGLFAASLWLDETDPAISPDSAKTIDIVQWVQYQLDNSSIVDDVIKSVEAQPVTLVSPMKLHFFVSDRMGQSVIVEITDKKMHCHLIQKGSTSCLTNDSYENSTLFLKNADLKTISPSDASSSARYVRMSELLKQYRGSRYFSYNHAFRMLDSVKQFGYTKWNIVYDQDRLCMYLRTESNREIRIADFSKTDFSCENVIQCADIINSEVENGLVKFRPFTTDDNRTLIKKSFSSTPGLQNLGDEVLNGLCGYIESLHCSK